VYSAKLFVNHVGWLGMHPDLKIKQRLKTQKVRGLYTDEGSIGLAIFKNV